jgi:hypothetical protein
VAVVKVGASISESVCFGMPDPCYAGGIVVPKAFAHVPHHFLRYAQPAHKAFTATLVRAANFVAEQGQDLSGGFLAEPSDNPVRFFGHYPARDLLMRRKSQSPRVDL